MSYERDRDSVTRGVGAIASLDHTNARQYQNRLARMRATKARDQKMVAIAMGALSQQPRPVPSNRGTPGRVPMPSSPPAAVPSGAPKSMRSGTGTTTIDHRPGADSTPVYDATAVHPTNTKPVYNPVTNKLTPYGTDPRTPGAGGVLTVKDHQTGANESVTVSSSNEGRGKVMRFSTGHGTRTTTRPAPIPPTPPAGAPTTSTTDPLTPAPITNTPATSTGGGGGGGVGPSTGTTVSPISVAPSPGVELPDVVETSGDDNMMKYAVIGGVALLGLYLVTRGKR